MEIEIKPQPLAPATAFDKMAAYVASPEGQALLAAAEARAAAMINGLPGAGNGTPGWKTSEFWTLVVLTLIGLLQMMSGFLPSPWGQVCLSVVGGLYIISRGLTKHGTGN